MKKIKIAIAVTCLALSSISVLAQGAESPFVGEMSGDIILRGHQTLLVIQHKTGAGCRDCAILSITDQQGVKMISPSLLAAVWPEIHFPEKGTEAHSGLYFDRWGTGDDAKLYLKVYANDTLLTHRYWYEWLVAYDLNNNTFTVGPRTNFSPP